FEFRGARSSFSPKGCPNPSCPLCAVATAPATGSAALRRHLAGGWVGVVPAATPLWAPPLCGLAAGAALAPCGQAACGWPLTVAPVGAWP
ncbi:hypothetical protein BHE74_00047339, partial [Ensete ventricosum]